MIDLVAAEGYPAVSIAQLSGHAGVSSATFYEQFSDKEDCALAAYATATERLLAQMQPVDREAATTCEGWSQSAATALGSLLNVVSVDTAAARWVFVEALAGGPQVREQRKQVMTVFQQRAQAFLASTPPACARLDLPPAALIGGVRSIVSRHLRTNADDQLPALAGDLVAWVQSYAIPAGRTPWSTGPRARLRLTAADRPQPVPATPRRLPRGRHRLPASVVARSHRTRIVHATAEVTQAKGYADTTVRDIVSAAGVSRQVFYEHFTDKQHAFLEAQHHPTQHILDTCAAAYFAPEAWPERVWSGLKALLELVVVNPALSHLRLVECYAAGPPAIRRAEEVTRSFTIFLEEGYRSRPDASGLPRITSQAIAGAIFEIVQRHAARGELEVLPSLLPQLTYIAIAPFTGAEEAILTLQQLIIRDQRKV